MNRPLHHRLGRLTAMALCALALATARADDGYDLYLYAAEADEYTSLDIANLRSLSFEQTREYNADSVRIYVNRVYVNRDDGSSTAYDLAGYDAILFATGGLDTGIGSITADTDTANPFSLSGRQLTMGASGTLGIHTIDGRTVSQVAVQAGQSLSLEGLPSGMYIIHMGAQAAKILVK